MRYDQRDATGSSLSLGNNGDVRKVVAKAVTYVRDKVGVAVRM